MALTKVTTQGITDNAVNGDKLSPGSVTTAKIGPSAVESSEIGNGTVTADDLASTLDLSPKTVTLAGSVVDSLKRPVQDNIALLGFKMAVNDGLTVFNLVDGVVDEFHDESGTDEAEGSNDTYCSTSDYYINSTSPSGGPISLSAGFTTTSITEPDTSTTGTNPAYGAGTSGQYAASTTSTNIFVWGAGGGRGNAGSPTYSLRGGGGGFASGTLATSPGQTLYVLAGEGGGPAAQLPAVPRNGSFLNGGKTSQSGTSSGAAGADGGGLAGVFAADLVPLSAPQYSAPQAYVVAGSGGGGGSQSSFSPTNAGGAGGGLIGDAGGSTTEQTNKNGANGGGGSQTAGGQNGTSYPSTPHPGQSGVNAGLFLGASVANYNDGGGGAGYYGGGTSHNCGAPRGGGGGSSYYGQPQITSGATEEGSLQEGGGTADPNYQADSNEGACSSNTYGEDGFVLLTSSASATTTSTTIVSTAFTAGSVPTSSRIVVFEENVATPTLNTDIIASISRDGGSNFTTATLSDSGYVTGSSGQRILTGQATISGQPSGQSMRWKLALANNAVKIHGVALQWS